MTIPTSKVLSCLSDDDAAQARLLVREIRRMSKQLHARLHPTRGAAAANRHRERLELIAELKELITKNRHLLERYTAIWLDELLDILPGNCWECGRTVAAGALHQAWCSQPGEHQGSGE